MGDESVNPPQRAGIRSGRGSSVVAVLLVVAPVLLYGVFALWSWRQDPHLGGDIALLEMSTRSAADVDAYVGPYSRFRWNHPGPAVFYWFAPFYFASGEAVGGLGVAAVGLVVASLAVVAICVVRHDRVVGAVSIVISASWFHLATGTDWYDNMWNPVMIIAPVVLVGVASAACFAGSQRWLPVAAVAASFGVQTHVGTVPVVMCFVVLAVVATVVGLRARPGDWVPAIGAAVLASAVMWALPIYEQFTRSPGNFSLLFGSDSATSGSDRSLSEVLDVVVGQLTLGDTRLVSDALENQIGLPAAGWLRILWLLSLLVTVAVVSWRAAIAGRRFHSALGITSIVAAAALVAALLGVSGDLKGYLTLSASSVGILLNFVLVSGVLHEIGARVDRDGASGGSHRRVEQAATAVALGAAIVATAAVLLGDSPARIVADRPGLSGVDAAVDRLVGADAGGRTARFDIVDNAGWPVVAAVADELERRGGSASANASSLYLFNDDRTSTGCETLIVSATTSEPPDANASGSQPITIGGVWLSPRSADLPELCGR